MWRHLYSYGKLFYIHCTYVYTVVVKFTINHKIQFSHLIQNFIDNLSKNFVVISEFLKYKQIIYKYVRNGYENIRGIYREKILIFIEKLK